MTVGFDMVKTGKFLSELRHEHHLTQEELGEKLGVTNKTVSRWETGTYMPPVDMLLAVSELYGVSVNEILSGRRLKETEVKEAAECNLTAALKGSAFSLKERMDYFKKKWKKEHIVSNIVEMLLLLVLLIVGLVLDNGLHFIAIIGGYVWGIVKYNQMMAYVEKHAFHGDDDKSGM